MERSKSLTRGVGKRIASALFGHRTGKQRKGLKKVCFQVPLHERRSLACQVIRMFQPKLGEGEELKMGEYHLSRTVDEFSMLSKPYVVKVSTLHKRKADKVRPVDLGVSDGSKPGG